MREGAKDRISDLPNDLLHQIHSFLGTKEGARTSVLSKRWNHIWTTVPVLEFWKRRESYIETYKFMNFVDGTLHRHSSSNINKFSLSWNWQLEENNLFEFVKDRVHSWISTVAKANVKDLSLCLYQKDPWFVPLSLFTSETLVSLLLQIDPSIRFPKYICLTRLKRLELRKFELSDESWNDELFSNSTVLEELILVRCTYGMRDFCISIPTLTVLEIDTWCGEENGGIRDCVLEIDAPKLVTFSYSGYVAKEFVLSSFPALAEAAIFFNFPADQELSQLLRALAHVKCLAVNDRTLQVIYSAYNLSNNLLTFHNVKMLKISDSVTTDQGLIALLKAVPNLESLIFHRYMYDEEEDSDEDDENDSDEDCSDDADDDNEDIDVADPAECRSTDEFEDHFGNDDYSWALDTVTTECLFSHLKSVCFQQFGGCPREMKWVRLILRKAKALQMMAIRYYVSGYRFVDAKSEKEVLVEIPNFTRASAGCRVKFCS